MARYCNLGAGKEFWDEWVGNQTPKDFLKQSDPEDSVWGAIRQYLVEGAFAKEYWELPEEDKERLEKNLCHTIARNSDNPDLDCTMTVKTVLKKWRGGK